MTMSWYDNVSRTFWDCVEKASPDVSENPYHHFGRCKTPTVVVNEILVAETMIPSGESKEDFCIFLLSLRNTCCQHNFPGGVGILRGNFFFCYNFKLMEKLQEE